MNGLHEYRKEINKIDEKLLLLLAKRFSIVEKIGKYKKSKKLPIVDRLREEKIIKMLNVKAAGYDIGKDCIKSIWKAIFKEAYSKE